MFPENDLEELRLDEHSDLILGRVLERGRLADVQWALRALGPSVIHDYLVRRASRDLSVRTIRFWRAYFRADGETWIEPSAFRQSSSAPWPS